MVASPGILGDWPPWSHLDTGYPRRDGQKFGGNWRPELLFVLLQQVELYLTYQKKICYGDLALRQHLESTGSQVDLVAQPLGPKPKGKKGGRHTPPFDLRTELYRITGIDWSPVSGIAVVTAQTVIAEWGADRWLGLVPTNEQSSGKILGARQE